MDTTTGMSDRSNPQGWGGKRLPGEGKRIGREPKPPGTVKQHSWQFYADDALNKQLLKLQKKGKYKSKNALLEALVMKAVEMPVDESIVAGSGDWPWKLIATSNLHAALVDMVESTGESRASCVRRLVVQAINGDGK